jgi:4-coumarate--CoA ligase (photoactive yellow protein activation family)
VKSFTITEEQIARIIGAASADELSRRFNRHFDFLTIAGWTSHTPLERGGIGMSDEEAQACGQRVSAFFGLDEHYLEGRPAVTIADWATVVAEALEKNLERFAFKGATRSNNNTVCAHAADEIYQDAAAAANLLYGRRRMLSFVAPHSLLGFVLSVLTPNLQHIDAVDARGMTPDMLSKTLQFGDVLIATPTLWRYMMREKVTAPDNTMAVSFGEAMTFELGADMRKAGFGVMRELYGSTETGLIGWRDSATEPFVLFDHWKRENDRLLRVRPDGAEKSVDAMDLIEWAGDRVFRLGGRRDGAVQIGAVNVFPEQVAEALGEHPRIKDCVVRAGRRGDGVNRLIAYIVLKPEFQPNDQTAREIDAWCRMKLRQQERPRIYNFEAVLSGE